MNIYLNLVLIGSFLFIGACKKASGEAPIAISSGICVKELTHDIDDNTTLQYTLCKEVSSSSQIESLRTFCGSIEIITNGSECSDYIGPTVEQGKCAHDETSFTLFGEFNNDGTDDDKATFLTGLELNCEQNNGTWTHSTP